MTMEAEKEQQKQQLMLSKSRGEGGEDVDEFGDYLGGSGESLLSLVQPEIKMLSKHWLVALKDYALLSLPPGIQNVIHISGVFEILYFYCRSYYFCRTKFRHSLFRNLFKVISLCLGRYLDVHMFLLFST